MYRLATNYPSQDTQIKFTKPLQTSNTPTLLQQTSVPSPQKWRKTTPHFYGILKIHKNFHHFPPLRPIVFQCSSELSPSAQLINHLLQPLAQIYPDYLHNSTFLLLVLQDLNVPDDAILVTVDVES